MTRTGYTYIQTSTDPKYFKSNILYGPVMSTVIRNDEMEGCTPRRDPGPAGPAPPAPRPPARRSGASATIQSGSKSFASIRNLASQSAFTTGGIVAVNVEFRAFRCRLEIFRFCVSIYSQILTELRLHIGFCFGVINATVTPEIRTPMY
ncbi:hypothetical protein EVAR_50264_1 [Eumeta japonica]|uniref:Uncharacterized protein n=1 Tax=Eumeta variegata TaxID=151549 RepID=A0A4C1Y644_EUMVA|nr:hypothetical protein EVAR_50264_1 [Eumeta japonica]